MMELIKDTDFSFVHSNSKDSKRRESKMMRKLRGSRRESISKVKVATSPASAITPQSSPASTHEGSQVDNNSKGLFNLGKSKHNKALPVIPETQQDGASTEVIVPVKALPPVPQPLELLREGLMKSAKMVESPPAQIISRSKSPAPLSPAIASSSSTKFITRPSKALPPAPSSSSSSNVASTISPRFRGASSPRLASPRFTSFTSSRPIAPPSPLVLSSSVNATTKKFSAQFLRAAAERRAKKEHDAAVKREHDAKQKVLNDDIALLQSRLDMIKKEIDDYKTKIQNCDEEARQKVAVSLLETVQQAIAVPTDQGHSKNGRMAEEQARRMKKKLAAQLIAEQESSNPELASIRNDEYKTQLERQEVAIERQIKSLKSQLSESSSRDANILQEKKRREERKQLLMERRNSKSHISPLLIAARRRGSILSKPLPPVQNGLFLKKAEAEKIASQPAALDLSRFERMKNEKIKRSLRSSDNASSSSSSSS